MKNSPVWKDNEKPLKPVFSVAIEFVLFNFVCNKAIAPLLVFSNCISGIFMSVLRNSKWLRGSPAQMRTTMVC